MARARRGAKSADLAEVSANAATPGVTAGGEAVDESKRGSQPVHPNPTQGATMATSGSPGGVADSNMNQGAFDGTEKPAKVRPPKATPAPVVKKWVVTRGGMIVANGARTRVAEGKIIDELNFDIRKIRSQGIQLRAATEDDVIL